MNCGQWGFCAIIHLVKHLRLFWEFFKISLFVVGGGYAIIVVADEIFGRKLKWLEEGELLEHLPVFQMVPGLIAGNTAIYTGLKIAGRSGAAAALFGAALPSFLIFLGVSMGYGWLPVDEPHVAGALAGLRAALTGIVFGTVAKSWGKSVRGVYGWLALAAGLALLVGAKAPVAAVLLGAMAVGVVYALAGGRLPPPDEKGAGVVLAPLSRGGRCAVAAGVAVALLAVTVLCGAIFWTFVKFGLLGFGGGFVLMPLYMQTFVGEGAPLLQLPAEEFSNLMALTQATPGPVSVNAATFFGYRMGGVGGALVATVALLLPSYFLLSAALGGLDRWKRSRLVQGILWGVRPATIALMLQAGLVFAGMAMWKGAVFQPWGALLAGVAFAAMLKRIPIMWTIAGCALLGAVG